MTLSLECALQHQSAADIHASNGGRSLVFAEGIPLKKDGMVVGAIGVSGDQESRIKAQRQEQSRFDRKQHHVLSKRKGECLRAWVQELDLQSPVLYAVLLTDQLI
jgi:hypothetical protein